MAVAQRIAVIIVAAGKGERASRDGDPEPKQYRLLAGKPVLSRTVEAFLAIDAIDHVVPVIHADHQQRYARLALGHDRLHPPVIGGATRQASVRAGLEALAPLRPDIVLIQDAARPFADAELIGGVIAALESAQASLPVTPVTDTIKRSSDGRLVERTEDRQTLFAAQTPQGFRFPQILSAHLRAARLPREFTDDAAIAEWAGLDVVLTPGSLRNIKLTMPGDFERAERMILGDRRMETRIGTGYDVHPFDDGQSVWLAGVEIAHTRKLKGHSDADVALHALCDAIYGALGEGDIGHHFPPSDMKWKGAASRIFLEHAAGLVAARGGRIVNLDITIVAEAPRIGAHVPAMRDVIGAICGINPSRVAVKATTNEKIGFVGREEGICAIASASVELPRQD
ncbi:2-C-methyl-D-erythritol 2,4-cyclodiphosphate synthase [Devosia enhydra]|uniref:Bifunctional enzyme IspD/IspF n=1 Tax=Devosia enhydra TaxID=665118 RepID=A0A1K2HUJ9_9HYPH|nr:bifunctional 2-C-methyl-D-erythritol 4-phosphate cytidylyltransferase/2-C-methyl-D-erythritol 2,4-cyclodiphosphate synthase [Devosia enhydra]SFZ82124.1 2-C-methyl-D-erythritol 2,4-cyclodiphosphate synthase [Devosia enhydra]